MKYEEFIEEVQKRAHLASMSVLVDALSKGEFEDIRAQLPIEFYNEFFEGK